MASSEGFLTEEQRERLTMATQNSEVLSSSPKSPSSLLSEHHIKAPAGGKGAVGVAGRHVRRTHSGKLHVFCDSRLIVGHLNDDYQVKDEQMNAYVSQVLILLE